MPRTSLFVFALLALPSFAHASPPPPVVEDFDPQRPDPQQPVVVEDLSRAPHQRHPAFDPSRGRMVGTFGFFGSGFDPGARRWSLSGSEIGALDGAAIPDAMLADHARYGGLTFGSGFRPLSWLRLPELRVYGGVGMHSAKLKVRDTALGALGSERIVAFAGDVGVELGFDVFFTEDEGERVGLRVAYRRGLVGAEGHGAFVGLAIQGKRPS